jgi:hypothetical protein
LKGLIVLLTPSSLYACAEHVKGWVIALIAVGILGIGIVSAQERLGQDNSRVDFGTQFLEKLRERGWHDVALEYLERANEDPLATPEFLADVDYQLAVTRAALARQAVGDRERQSLQEQAISGFKEFSQEHPDSKNYVAALSQVSNMLAEQALVTLNKADRLPGEAASEQDTLRYRARATIDEAAAAAEQLLVGIDKWLSTLPRGAALQADKRAAAFKQDLLGKQAEGRFLAANLDFEKARTYSSGSQEHDDALQTAATGFKQLQKDYENKLVGFYAVLYEGRCYQQAGDLKQALETYGELINQPVGQADFRKLIARAYRHRAECHLANDDVDKVIEECQEWLNQSRSEELAEPEWLAVQYRLGEAYAKQAESDSGDGNVSRLRAEARKLFRDITKHSGEFQDDARAALALSGSESVAVAEVSGFADALAAGKSAIEQMGPLQLAVKLAANNNPEAVDDLRDRVATNRAAALKYFEQAVGLIDDKTLPDDAVAARYYLCWLYWEDGRTTEAAQLGEQIAEKHADSPFAATAAKVTLAAYERLYLEAREAGVANDIAASTAKLRQIAELIVDRWNDSDAATTATNLLISIALRESKFDEADRLLEKLPESSRGAAGLSLGASLWSHYLQQAAANGGEPSPAVLDLKSRATKLLAAGYKSLADSSDINATQAAGVLYYAQALLADGAADEALLVLENKRIGPLAVMKRGGADQKDRAFAIETCKAALRAYVSVDPPRRDDAVAMMEQLETLTGDSEQAQKQLTAIYVNLGLQLQEQIRQLSAAGKQDKARAVAEAFSSLLRRVAERGDAQSWAVRNWLAQTSLQLGSGLSGAEANRYFTQAEKAYRDILTTAEMDPKFAPSEIAVLAVRKKLGETLQARGNFADAIEQYSAILTQKPNMLEIQQATAAALQAWGHAKKDAKTLELAIRGTNPAADGKNRVWGWLRLAEVADFAKRKAEAGATTPENTAAAKKYEEVYFTARLQAAKARLDAAKLAQGDSQAKQFATVRQSIVALKQLYPNLGGTRWQPQFDALLKEAGG